MKNLQFILGLGLIVSAMIASSEPEPTGQLKWFCILILSAVLLGGTAHIMQKAKKV